MNDDRCYHVPMSEGQSMCSCQDVIIWQRTVIAALSQVIADQERRLNSKPYRVLTPLSEDGMLDPSSQQKET